MSKKTSPESARNIAELAEEILTLIANPQVLEALRRVILDESSGLTVDARQTALAFVDYRPAEGVAARLGRFVCKAEIFLANPDDSFVQNFLCDFYRQLYQITCTVKLITYRNQCYRRKLDEHPEPVTPRDTNNCVVRLAHLIERYVAKDLKKNNHEIYTKAAVTSRAFSSLATIDQLEESQRLTDEYFGTRN